MKKFIWLLIFLTLIFIVGCSHVADKETTSKVPAPGFENVPEAIVSDSGSGGDNVKEISVTAKQWAFDPNPIIVNKGDKVKLSIKSIDVTHGFSLPDFGINRELKPGKTEIVEFVADKAGQFTFFCNVICGAGHSDMKGTLIVNE